MALKLRVTPEQLDQAKSKLDGQISEYKALYDRLYQEVGNMKQSWSGEANQRFTQQIQGFKNDFEDLARLLQQYSQFIKETAADYRRTEGNLANEAGKLKVGK